jgi:hypothetical protein
MVPWQRIAARKGKMRFLGMLGLALPLLAAAAGPASAQAVPPLGQWASAKGNVLVVNDDATCTYQTPQVRAQGSCSWHGVGPADGILVIDNPVTGQQALPHMDVSIHWINRGRITVLGEPFQRR